jgi:cyclopropane-fatty-acyl-phospholipid synthase
MATAQHFVTDLLARAGWWWTAPRPGTLQVHDPQFFGRVLRHKNQGLGESYMDGWWDCPRVDEFIHRLLAARLDEAVRDSPGQAWPSCPGCSSTARPGAGAAVVARRHYDLGNDLFEGFRTHGHMQYSCAYFRDGDDLEAAQRRKLDLICDKLGLSPA